MSIFTTPRITKGLRCSRMQHDAFRAGGYKLSELDLIKLSLFRLLGNACIYAASMKW